MITGGGTAGHVLPALAIAEELEERGHPAESLHYVGAQRGIETRLLPETPYPHTFLDVVGVQRRAVRANVAFLPKLAARPAAARRLLVELRPRVVVSVGGYASLPAVLAARRLRIPVVVVSFDRLPGRASALAARFAAASAVAFEGSSLRRAVVTGAPVRRAIRDVDRVAGQTAARAALGLPTDRFVIAVTGGSQGSGALNDAIIAYAAEHAEDTDLAIYHVAGERFVAGVTDDLAAPSGIGPSARRLRAEDGPRLRSRRPPRRPRWGVDRRRGRRHRDAVDPRSVVRGGGGPPDRQRPLAR